MRQPFYCDVVYYRTILFKLANKSLLLYIFVSVLWFYLVLYVFHCPKSIDYTERCYQFVIMYLLSIGNRYLFPFYNILNIISFFSHNIMNSERNFSIIFCQIICYILKIIFIVIITNNT